MKNRNVAFVVAFCCVLIGTVGFWAGRRSQPQNAPDPAPTLVHRPSSTTITPPVATTAAIQTTPPVPTINPRGAASVQSSQFENASPLATSQSGADEHQIVERYLNWFASFEYARKEDRAKIDAQSHDELTRLTVEPMRGLAQGLDDPVHQEQYQRQAKEDAMAFAKSYVSHMQGIAGAFQRNSAPPPACARLAALYQAFLDMDVRIAASDPRSSSQYVNNRNQLIQSANSELESLKRVYYGLSPEISRLRIGDAQ